MSITGISGLFLIIMSGAFLRPADAQGQHAFGIMGDYLVKTRNIENANLGLRLSYDMTLGDEWTLRGMIGGMAGGQVALFEALPRPTYPGLPIDTVKVDERERYVHFTIGARRYLFGGGFGKGGAYAHLGVHVGLWSFSAETEAYNTSQYTIPALGLNEDDLTLLLFPVGLGYEWRAGKLVPFAEFAYMPGTSLGDGAEFMQGMGITVGLRFPFGEGKGE